MSNEFARQRAGLNLSAGTGLAQVETVVFSGSNNISFGAQVSASSVVATASIGMLVASAGTQTAAPGTVILSNGNGISFGMSGSSQITVSSGFSNMDFENMPYQRGLNNLTAVVSISDRPLFIPFTLPYNITFHRMVYELSMTGNTDGPDFEVHVGLYTVVNFTQIALWSSTRTQYFNTNLANTSVMTGIRHMYFDGLSSVMTPGPYVFGVMFHQLLTATTLYMGGTIRGASIDSPLGVIGAGADLVTTATSQLTSVGGQFFGLYSVTTSTLPAAVADSNLFKGLSGTQMALPIWFRIERTA